jgi:type IV pilus assembly protein PilC
MLEGGIPLVKALEVLWRQSDSPDFQIAISRIRERLDKGSSLAEAFGEFPRIFPQIYCALLHVAEKGGGIVEILRKLGDYLNFQKMLITRIKRAIIYPAIVFVFSIVVVILMFIWVIPTFRVVLTRINVKLPFLTQLMLDISSFMRSGYFWIGLGIILSFLFIYYKKFSRTVTMDNLKLKLPLFGSILYTNLMIKFLYSLHLLIEAGVPLVTALSIAKTVVLNKKILQALDTVEKSVIEGSSFSHSLATTKMFPLLLIQMVAVGEESGTLPEMLRRSYLHFEE